MTALAAPAAAYGIGNPASPLNATDPFEPLLSSGRLAEATALARQAIARAPRAPEAWAALGRCLLAAHRPQEAAAALDEALRLAPEAPELLCAKAAILQGLGHEADARKLYARALERDADRFEALFGLALQAVAAGDWGTAERWAARLGGRHGDLPNVRWLAARIDLARGRFEPAAARLSALLAGDGLSGEQRADALLMLATACDGAGEPPQAFAAALAGKRLQRTLAAEIARSREGAAARYLRLAEAFARARPGDWGPAPGSDAGGASGQVFIVGFPRSGTTLLEQALAGHSRVVALEEAPTLAAAHAEFLGDGEGLERLRGLDAAAAYAWRARYWSEVAAHGVEVAGRVFVDKQPAGTDDLPIVAKLFPGARVLFALRDPRDVVLSCLMNNFQLNAVTYAFTELGEAARCYAAAMDLWDTYRPRLPLAWRYVRHEAVVEDFEAQVREVCGFLDIAWEPAMADVAATARRRSVRTPSAPQVREGLNRRGLGRWRAYADALAPVLPTLAPWVRRYGYPDA